MQAREQEQLYAATRLRHPTWTGAKCSGYVHGANDSTIRKEPLPSYLDQDGDYAVGYMQGWTDHHED